MRSTAPMRTAKIGCIAISCAMCFLGLLMLLFPNPSSALIGAVCGVLLILFGCVRLIGYFSKDLYRLAFQFDLTIGVVAVVLGVALLARPGELMTFLCAAVGLFILTDGLLKIRVAVESKRFGTPSWWLTLCVAASSSVCGLLLTLRPDEGGRFLTILIGVTLLSEGLLSVSAMLTAVKIIRHQQPDVIEATEYREL